jgi:hypothetical protein
MTCHATKETKTLNLLKKGWITSLECALKGGCLSLSQRVSELRASGRIVMDKWVITKGGSKVKAYRLAK